MLSRCRSSWPGVALLPAFAWKFECASSPMMPLARLPSRRDKIFSDDVEQSAVPPAEAGRRGTLNGI